MPVSRTNQVIDYLRRTAFPREGAALTDGREVGGEIEQAKAAFDREKADYEKAVRNRALREIDEAVTELKSNPPPNRQKELELLTKIKNAVEGIMPPPVDTGRPGPGPGGPRNP
jgi:hypothetical protein